MLSRKVAKMVSGLKMNKTKNKKKIHEHLSIYLSIYSVQLYLSCS